MAMTPEEARNVFNAIGRSGAAIAALGQAAELDAAGDLSDDDLITVIQDYLAAQEHLESVRLTRGLLPPAGWPAG